MTRIETIRNEHPLPLPQPHDPLNPLNIIRNIGSVADADAIITTDVGQHQMWVAQVYPFRRTRTLLTSGGLGTMGFGLPAAIGAALAHPGKAGYLYQRRRVDADESPGMGNALPIFGLGNHRDHHEQHSTWAS
jgi:TPP-dependent 2-oxoacid decarboxylase